jgi:hypothetical protein
MEQEFLTGLVLQLGMQAEGEYGIPGTQIAMRMHGRPLIMVRRTQ